MSEDLTKAEQRWRTRALFRPQRRGHGRRLLFLLLVAAAGAAVIYWAEVSVWLQAGFGVGA